ncbi:MAG: RadC family protein [Flavobacteriales bacterium]
MKHDIQIEQLSDVQLLQLVCGSAFEKSKHEAVLERTWRWHQKDWRTLARSSTWDLLEIYGLDITTAQKITGVFELSRRYQASKVKKRNQIKKSKDVYELLQPKLSDLDHEQFFVLYLSFSNEIIEMMQLSVGGRHSTIADAKRIFQYALRCAAIGIILCHNHPSGSLLPSDQDKMLTSDIQKFAKLIDMKLLDHLIFTDNGYFSFADEGLL